MFKKVWSQDIIYSFGWLLEEIQACMGFSDFLEKNMIYHYITNRGDQLNPDVDIITDFTKI